MPLTGAQIIWDSLVRQGVTDVFGYPGGAILPAYDAMLGYPVRHILVRHEQGATHMADGYARASGKVGVAIATSGPGATNMVTGIATAMMDSSPIVCITGQVGSKVIGSDAFQEIDITGITLPITKHNYLVTRAQDIAPAIFEAFAVAKSGRPGPVLVDITKDAQQASCEVDWAAAEAAPGRGVRRGAARRRRLPRRGRADQHGRAAADSRRPRRHAVGRRARRAPARRARRHSDRRDAARHRRRPGVASAQSRHDGHARRGVRQPRDPAGGSADRARHALRRSRHGQPEDLRAHGEEDSRRHRSRRIEQERPRRRRHREGLADGARRVDAARQERRSPCVARDDRCAQGRLGGSRHPEPARQRASVCRPRHQRSLAPDRWRRGGRDRRRPAPDVGGAVLQAREVAFADHLRRSRDDGLRAAGGDWRQGRAAGRRSLGGRAATADSR